MVGGHRRFMIVFLQIDNLQATCAIEAGDVPRVQTGQGHEARSSPCDPNRLEVLSSKREWGSALGVPQHCGLSLHVLRVPG